VIPKYTVHALRTGSIRLDKTSVVHGVPHGTTVTVPIFCAAVEGNGAKILVDTGIADVAKWSTDESLHSQTPDQTLEAALSEIGWRPKDVDLVVNSHLHYDHGGNNLSLPRAQFFVSDVEWDAAADPTNVQRAIYDYEWTGPEVSYLNYTLIATDHYDLLAGIRVIQTPGHSAGHQSVLVNTDEGVLCVTGDAACMIESLEAPTPPGTFVSSQDALQSIQKICELSDRVLMNHDPEVADFQTSGFPVPPEWPRAWPAGDTWSGAHDIERHRPSGASGRALRSEDPSK
jgi:N-acyl homoserine lactone hydrolase